jgi:hypothetical protein
MTNILFNALFWPLCSSSVAVQSVGSFVERSRESFYAFIWNIVRTSKANKNLETMRGYVSTNTRSSTSVQLTHKSVVLLDKLIFLYRFKTLSPFYGTRNFIAVRQGFLREADGAISHVTYIHLTF